MTMTANAEHLYGRIGKEQKRVRRLGLGTGGASKGGLAQGAEHCASVVRHAIQRGLQVIDTAEYYGTEPAVGAGLRGFDHASLWISTKIGYQDQGVLRSAAAIESAIERARRNLGLERLDLLQLHAVRPEDYRAARDQQLPVLRKLQQRGWIGNVGISEGFASDPGHLMLQQAVADGCWDALLVGYSLLNTSARELVIDPARAKGISTMCMFAIRGPLTSPDKLRGYLDQLVTSGRWHGNAASLTEQLAQACTDLGGIALSDLAYRFACSQHGFDVVLSGTGNPGHLDQNITSSEHQLSDEMMDRLHAISAGERVLTGN
jgi:aryl-alcohol dehydrogenase-like predicted oxidoreductase